MQDLPCENVRVDFVSNHVLSTVTCDVPAGSGLVDLTAEVLGVQSAPVSIAFLSEHAPEILAVSCSDDNCLVTSGASVTVSIQVKESTWSCTCALFMLSFCLCFFSFQDGCIDILRHRRA